MSPVLRARRLSLQKGILAVKKQDQAIHSLMAMMEDMYGFLLDVDNRSRLDSQKAIVQRMVQQTLDCGYFIREYTLTDKLGESTEIWFGVFTPATCL